MEDHAAVIATAQDFFASGQSVFLARAPGRLDVMGGNVDYTGGAVLQGLLQEAVWAASQLNPHAIIRVFNPGAAQFGWETRFEFTLDALRDIETVQGIGNQQEGGFWGRYVLGAIHFLLNKFQRPVPDDGRTGLNLFIHSDLPPNRGVSSSAALTISVLKAIAAAWHIQLEGIGLATAGQWVENVVAAAACGIMDQAAIVLGRRDHLLPLLCQPCLPYPVIALPAGIHIWGIDSMAPRSTTGAAYKSARAAAFMGYRMICEREGSTIIPDATSSIPRWTDARWNGYLSNLCPSEFRSLYERWLPESMTGAEFLERYGEHVDPFTTVDPSHEYPVRSAVRYATEESLRVQTVGALLEATAWGGSESALRLIGEIFYQSHHAYTECGLRSEACDELVERARHAGLLGAKMTGGGAGGVVAVLGRAEDRGKCIRMTEKYAADRGQMPHIFEGSSDGVDAFDTRVLQAADFAGQHTC